MKNLAAIDEALDLVTKEYVDALGGSGNVEVYPSNDPPAATAYAVLWADLDDVVTGSTPSRTVSTISTSTAAATAQTDYCYVCTAVLTLTLPTAVGRTNLYTVKSMVSGDVTIATTASQTIDGASSLVLSTQYQAVTLISTGSNWVVI